MTGFVRWIDGNASNNVVTNLAWVTLQDAMEHVDDWKVDWDMHLTKRERALVMTAAWRAALSFE